MAAPIAAPIMPDIFQKSDQTSTVYQNQSPAPIANERVEAAANTTPTYTTPKNKTTKSSNPFKKLFGTFKTTSPKPTFSKPEDYHIFKLGSTALRAQIISNALVVATMACVHADYAGEVLKVDDPPLHIVTTNEGNKVQAAVVYYQYLPQQHSKVATVFRGALAASDVEALESLYEESKRVATNWKLTLEERCLWAVG